MIRVVIVIIAALLFFMFHRANDGTTVVITYFGRVSPPLAIEWLLLYAFLSGAVAYALFTLPERIRTWMQLYKNKKSLRKMGKNLTNVINVSKPK
ncbi:MAG: hypothetical protein ACE5FN_06395 [Leptospirillia bacterium]